MREPQKNSVFRGMPVIRFAKAICALFCGVFFLCACRTSIAIPGEAKIKEANIAAENYAIAEAYFDLQNYAKAAEYYKKTMRYRDYSAQAAYKLARSYVFLKNWTEAETLFKSLLTNDKDNTNLQLSLAYVYASENKIQDALLIYKNLIKKEEYDAVLLQNAMLLYLAIKDYEGAQNLFELYKERFPKDDKIAEFQSKIQKETLENNEKKLEQ